MSCILTRCDDHFGASLFFRIDSTTQFVRVSRVCAMALCVGRKSTSTLVRTKKMQLRTREKVEPNPTAPSSVILLC